MYSRLLNEEIPQCKVIKKRKRSGYCLDFMSHYELIKSKWEIRNIVEDNKRKQKRIEKCRKYHQRRARRLKRKVRKAKVAAIREQRSKLVSMIDTETYLCLETGVELEYEDVYCLNFGEIMRAMRDTVKQINDLNGFIASNCGEFEVDNNCRSLKCKSECELVVERNAGEAINSVLGDNYFVSYIEHKGKSYRRLKKLKEV